MNYPELAAALLECGDDPDSIALFLHDEYGLESAQADAAIVLARFALAQAAAEPGQARHSRSRAATDAWTVLGAPPRPVATRRRVAT